jgi:hypothetical protein
MIQSYVFGLASEMIHCQVDETTNGKAYLNDNPHYQVEPNETVVALAVMSSIAKTAVCPACFHEFSYITRSLAYSQISLFFSLSEGTSHVDCLKPKALNCRSYYSLHNYPSIYPFGSKQERVNFYISH